MKKTLVAISLLSALVIAPVASAADGKLLVVSKTYSDGQTLVTQLQMDSAQACQSAKVANQGRYDSLSALGWPAKASVECV